MAKRRMIDTRFWSDSFIIELNPLDRYLFLYLLTNEHTNIAGIYELPLKRMADETGIEKEMLTKMLKRLKGKVAYVKNWVAIRNFSKYQSDNESVRKGVENARTLIPSQILEDVDNVWQGVDTLGTECDISELKLKPELKLESEVATTSVADSKNINTLIEMFKEVNPSYKRLFANKSQRSAIDRLVKEHGMDKVINAIEVAKSVFGQKYAPTITTPIQLETKLGQLGAYYKQEKSKQTKVYKI